MKKYVDQALAILLTILLIIILLSTAKIIIDIYKLYQPAGVLIGSLLGVYIILIAGKVMYRNEK